MKKFFITLTFILLAACFVSFPKQAQATNPSCLDFSGNIIPNNWSTGSLTLRCGAGTYPPGHPWCPGDSTDVGPGDDSYTLTGCDCTVSNHVTIVNHGVPGGCIISQNHNTGQNGNNITENIYVNCPAPTATPVPATPTPLPTIGHCGFCFSPQDCLARQGCGDSCNDTTHTCYQSPPTATPGLPACGQPCNDNTRCVSIPGCNACINGTCQPPITATPAPPGNCTPGLQCNCDGLNGNDPPDQCRACGGSGGWCKGGLCECLQPPPGPPPPPPATPTPVQPTQEITAPPTPTVNPAVPTPTPGSGQNPLAKLSQRWVCLDSQPCSAGGCSNQGQVDHRAKISAKTNDAKPLSSTDTYIFECIRIPDPNRPGRTIQKCTTGVQSVDNASVGSSILPDLQHSLGYKYNGIFKANGIDPAQNPVPPDQNNNGNFGFREWESYTTNNIDRLFFAMNWYDPNGPQAGNEFSEKQATLSYDTASKKCIMIRWDPQGTVFDSKSLKPVAGAEVTLLKKLPNGQFVPVTDDDVLGGGLQNPYLTKDDGKFAFYVPDGTYKLMIKKDNYTYPAQVASEKSFGGFKNIYYGEEFTQKGKIHEYDIPLDPDYSAIIRQKVASLFKSMYQVFSK